MFPVCRGKAGDQSKRNGNLIPKNSLAIPLTGCRSRRGLPYHLSTVSSPSNDTAAIQSTPLEDGSFPPGPERLVALEDLSAPSAPSPAAPAVGDGIHEAPYRPFNEHFSHHNGGGDTGAPQPDGDATEDRCYSPLYGENQTLSGSLGDNSRQ